MLLDDYRLLGLTSQTQKNVPVNHVNRQTKYIKYTELLYKINFKLYWHWIHTWQKQMYNGSKELSTKLFLIKQSDYFFLLVAVKKGYPHNRDIFVIN
jgi:hypothetical protein